MHLCYMEASFVLSLSVSLSLTFVDYIVLRFVIFRFVVLSLSLSLFLFVLYFGELRNFAIIKQCTHDNRASIISSWLCRFGVICVL